MTTLTTTQSASRPTQVHHLLHRIAKPVLFRMLTTLRHGRITITQDGESSSFGPESALHATIFIKDPKAYVKLLLGGSIGAGEAYINGWWKSDNLTTLVRIIALNIDLLEDIERKMAWLMRPVRRLNHFLNRNSKSGSKKNILAHYDLGNDLYQAFLDPTMMYSSAIYPQPDSTLEEASRHKLELICRKLDLKPEDHVVEIGSGWGGFAIHAASRYGCHVTTTTISEAQYQEADKRIREAGLEDRITLLRKDYRELRGSYDKLVSIEMIEAVGYSYLPVFFKKCSSLLKSGGMMLLQAITIQDQKFETYIKDVDFIQKHIFPGGCLISNSHMLSLISRQTNMIARSIEDFGLDYARTLAAWRKRFIGSFQHLEQYGYDDRFKRLWEFYLCYCEGGFLERTISVVHLTATKPANRQSVRLS